MRHQALPSGVFTEYSDSSSTAIGIIAGPAGVPIRVVRIHVRAHRRSDFCDAVIERDVRSGSADGIGPVGLGVIRDSEDDSVRYRHAGKIEIDRKGGSALAVCRVPGDMHGFGFARDKRTNRSARPGIVKVKGDGVVITGRVANPGPIGLVCPIALDDFNVCQITGGTRKGDLVAINPEVWFAWKPRLGTLAGSVAGVLSKIRSALAAPGELSAEMAAKDKTAEADDKLRIKLFMKLTLFLHMDEVANRVLSQIDCPR